MGAPHKSAAVFGRSGGPHHKNLRDETDDIKDALNERATELATELLGSPPNKRLATSDAQRWGNKGSFKLETRGYKRGLWKDHEAGQGGDVFDLIQLNTTAKTFPDVVKWAKDWLGWRDYETPTFQKSTILRRAREERAAADKAEADEKAKEQFRKARTIWREATDIRGTIAEIYLRDVRKLDTSNLTDKLVRYSAYMRAVVFPVTNNAGEFKAVHLVFLTPEGEKDKTRGESAKITISSMGNDGAIRFPASVILNVPTMCVLEGPENAITVWASTGIATVAVMSVDRLKNAEHIADAGQRIIIGADDDKPTASSILTTKKAVKHLLDARRDVRVARPFETATTGEKRDFNNLLEHYGREAVRARVLLAALDEVCADHRKGLSRKEATAKLREYFGKFREAVRSFREGEQPKIYGFGNTTGGGKSHHGIEFTVEEIVHLRQNNDKRAIVFAAPEHALIEQLAERLKAEAFRIGAKITVRIWRGRGALSPGATSDDDRMCERLDDIQLAHRLLVKPDDEVCPQCPARDACKYLAQRAEEADVWIITQDFIFGSTPPAAVTRNGVAALIIDETVWQSGLTDEIEIPLDNLLPNVVWAGGAENELTAMRHSLAMALEPEFEGLGKHQTKYMRRKPIVDAKFTQGRLLLAAEREFARIVTEGDWRERGENATIRRMWALFQTVADLVGSEFEDTGNAYLTVTEEGVRVIRIQRRKNLQEAWNVPTMLLDANFDVELNRPHWPTIEELPYVHVDAPHQTVIQDATKTYAKKWFEPPKATANLTGENLKGLERSKATARRKAADVIRKMTAKVGGKAVAIGNKSVVQNMPLGGEFPILWFNKLAGHDQHKDANLVAIIGAPRVRPEIPERLAAALTGRPPTVEIERGGWYPKADAHRLIRRSDGAITRIATQTDRHPDPMVERIRWQITEGQLEQAVGRARGCNRTPDNPVTVLVLGDPVLTVPVDRFTTDEETRVTPFERMLLAGGVGFTSGAMASRAYPELWKSADSAKKAFQRSAGQSPESILTGECPVLRQVTFNLAIQGSKPSSALWDPSKVSDIRVWLEARLGPLAWIEETPSSRDSAAVETAPIHNAAPLDLPDSAPIDDGWRSEVVPEPIELQDITTVPVPIQISSDGVTIRSAWVHIPIESAERPRGEELRAWCASVRRRAEDSGVLLGDIALKAGSSFGEFKAVERGLWPLRPEMRLAFEAAVFVPEFIKACILSRHTTD